MLIHSWRAPLGEPVFDDYDFLHHALFDGGSWFDGGGISFYWRPLSRQAYYAVFGPLMLAQPRLLALIHAVMVVLAAVLLYRALRTQWNGPLAALSATFPLFSEGTRTLLLWPSAFQDLGALLFTSLAIHEAAHRRRATALVAVLAGLLCKEIALVAALLVPWLPIPAHAGRKWRVRFALGTAGVGLAWGAAYLLVRQSGSVMFQRQLGQLEGERLSLTNRLLWALAHAVVDAFNLDLGHPAPALWALGMVVVLVLAANLIRRRSTPPTRPAWIAWGLAWFFLTTAMLSETFPWWGSFRSVVGLAGLGIAMAGALAGLGVTGVALLTALRLTMFFLAPGAPQTITPAPPAEGFSLDFDSVARLQRYVGGIRRLVTARFPELPPGSAIGFHYRPSMAGHALASGRAFQVWYRDSTLQSYEWAAIVANPARRMKVVLEYEPYQERQAALVDGEAMFEYVDAIRIMGEGRFSAALSKLLRADSLQNDRGAVVFLGCLAGRRAVCRLGLDDTTAAQQEATRSLELWPDGTEGRFAQAILLAIRKDHARALAQLDTLLIHSPSDKRALKLRDNLRIEAGRAWRR